MIEKELEKMTAQIGGMEEFGSLFVRVYLKVANETEIDSLEGHIPSKSYITNNTLILYTSSKMNLEKYFVPPPMIRYFEIIRRSGGWSVELLEYNDKIPCIRAFRQAASLFNVTAVSGLRAQKELIESCPVMLVEGLKEQGARDFMQIIEEAGGTCVIVEQH